MFVLVPSVSYLPGRNDKLQGLLPKHSCHREGNPTSRQPGRNSIFNPAQAMMLWHSAWATEASHMQQEGTTTVPTAGLYLNTKTTLLDQTNLVQHPASRNGQPDVSGQPISKAQGQIHHFPTAASSNWDLMACHLQHQWSQRAIITNDRPLLLHVVVQPLLQPMAITTTYNREFPKCCVKKYFLLSIVISCQLFK